MDRGRTQNRSNRTCSTGSASDCSSRMVASRSSWLPPLFPRVVVRRGDRLSADPCTPVQGTGRLPVIPAKGNLCRLDVGLVRANRVRQVELQEAEERRGASYPLVVWETGEVASPSTLCPSSFCLRAPRLGREQPDFTDTKFPGLVAALRGLACCQVVVGLSSFHNSVLCRLSQGASLESAKSFRQSLRGGVAGGAQPGRVVVQGGYVPGRIGGMRGKGEEERKVGRAFGLPLPHAAGGNEC